MFRQSEDFNFEEYQAFRDFMNKVVFAEEEEQSTGKFFNEWNCEKKGSNLNSRSHKISKPAERANKVRINKKN